MELGTRDNCCDNLTQTNLQLSPVTLPQMFVSKLYFSSYVTLSRIFKHCGKPSSVWLSLSFLTPYHTTKNSPSFNIKMNPSLSEGCSTTWHIIEVSSIIALLTRLYYIVGFMDVEIIQLGKKGSIISFFWSNYFDFFENVTTLTKICFMHKPQIVRPFLKK